MHVGGDILKELSPLRPVTNRYGRKKKSSVIRDSKGKSRGEPAPFVHPETIACRKRDLIIDGVNPAHVLDPLSGSTLGRLLLRWRADNSDPGSINQEQFDAGDIWTKIVHRHAAIITSSKLSVKSPSAILIGGHSLSVEPDEETILRVRRQFRETYNALQKASGTHGWRLSEVCYGVCVENWPLHRLSEADYGALRVGLNALVRVLG